MSTENNAKALQSKSYNKTKRFEKESFDSDFMNSSQSIKFGVSGRKNSLTTLDDEFKNVVETTALSCYLKINYLVKIKKFKFCKLIVKFLASLQFIIGSQNTHSKVKPKNKWFVYKRSRIDKLVIDNITKMKSKEDKATLKKIKEVEDIISKKGELIMHNKQVRLNNAKSNKIH